MRGSYAECKAELEHASSLWGPSATVSEIRVLKTELPLTARLQANHDNASWTWEVNNHRLALVLSLWIEQNTQRRLESENKRGAYECVCILERMVARDHRQSLGANRHDHGNNNQPLQQMP